MHTHAPPDAEAQSRADRLTHEAIAEQIHKFDRRIHWLSSKSTRLPHLSNGKARIDAERLVLLTLIAFLKKVQASDGRVT